MYRSVKRWMLDAGLGLVLIVATAAAATEVRSKRRFGGRIRRCVASNDPAVIAQGRYLVYGPAACAYPPRPEGTMDGARRGRDAAALGQPRTSVCRSAISTRPNLTPDLQTGIGRRTDGELARILRYGVRAGRASGVSVDGVPGAERRGPHGDRLVPPRAAGRSGSKCLSIGSSPIRDGPDGVRHRAGGPRSAPEACQARRQSSSVTRGEYLANVVVVVCLVPYRPRSGERGARGPEVCGSPAAGHRRGSDKGVRAAQLDADPLTSPIGQWNEDAFVVRFRQGETIKGTLMPWGAYARMTEEDMRSVFRYLRSLEPVAHATGPVVQDKR